MLTGMLTAATMLATSCDKGFEDMNKNPNALTDPVLENLFTYNLVKNSWYRI